VPEEFPVVVQWTRTVQW